MTGSLANLSGQQVALMLVQLVVVIGSIVFHEVCHGLMAYRLGDPTAKNSGRLTANPLKHLDPFGSVILPLLLMFTGSAVFAYAKPVPYNPAYFKNRDRGELLVAFAGPTANLALGCVGAIVMWIAYGIGGGGPAAAYDGRYWLYLVGYELAWINFVLFFFNILPIPPLDGSTIIGACLRGNAKAAFYRIKNSAMLVFMIVVLVLPYVFHWDPLGAYLRFTAGGIMSYVSPAFTYYVGL